MVQPKKGKGICAVIVEVSEEFLDFPSNIKVLRGAIERVMLQGDELSPLKPGQNVSVPHDLTYALATHSRMMPVAGDGEASTVTMKAVALAVLAGTKHEGKMDVEYVWRKTRESHPEIINLERATKP
jgi:hypothetical protein